MLADPETVQPILDQLAIDGLVATVAGAYRLTDAGKARVADLLAAERAAWGVDQAVAALDAFVDLDHRMKDDRHRLAAPGRRRAASSTTTPTRPTTRACWTGSAALHADTAAWLEPVEPGCPRLGAVRGPARPSAEQALAGDGRYVASPRVDSYHGIWFELHEDLIQLAGRTREDEVAAGRA